MKAIHFGLLILAGLVGVLVLGGCSVLAGYNRAMTLDEQVDNAWAQVDVDLQRRFDLIPNAIETVKGVAGQEEKIFLGVAEARKAYVGATTTNEKARAAGEVESALSRLLMLREAYPTLGSNEAFMKLQDQLEGTENRISVSRKRYNDVVTELNTMTRTFPGSFYASLAGVEAAERFDIEPEARDAPQVDFSE